MPGELDEGVVRAGLLAGRRDLERRVGEPAVAADLLWRGESAPDQVSMPADSGPNSA